MDLDPKRLSTALQQIYSATIEPADRARLPHYLAAAFDATSCLVYTLDDGPMGVTVIGGTENMKVFLPTYGEHYHTLDLWAHRAMRRPNQVFVGQELVPEDELLRTEIYNDCLRPSAIHHIVGSIFDLQPGAGACIAIHRTAGTGGFGEGERAMARLIVPHLGQALRLMRKMEAAERSCLLSFDALAALSAAVFIVDVGGRVKLMNSRAERLAASNTHLRVRTGRLGLAEPRLHDRLRSAIRSAALAPLGRSLHAGETIAVPVADGAPLSLMIVPLPPTTDPSSSAEPLAAVFAGQGEAPQAFSPELLAVLYRLTPAESRLLLAVLKGERLAEIAKVHGTSINTVSTQLKSILAKTGTHRQSELIAKVMSDPVLRLAAASK